MFAGIPGGCQFRRGIHEAVCKEHKPLREAVVSSLRFLAPDVLHDKMEGDREHMEQYKAPNEE